MTTQYLCGEKGGKAAVPAMDIHTMAIVYFCLITLIGYALYITKKGKG